MTPKFKTAVQTYGPRFMSDLGLTALHVAGIFGNLAVESAQFTALQETNPTVKGSRGGWGWPQWTGPRRRQFEAWAGTNGYRLDDPAGFYSYMLVELRGSEAKALSALRRTKTLDTATTAFMRGYERPGVPHLEKRKAYALEALNVLIEAGVPGPAQAAAAPQVAAPEAKQVPAPPPAVAAPWWRRLLPGATKPAPVLRPGLAPNGDPALWDVQSKLKRFGYEPILLDGLNGERTRNAIRAARKRNSLPPGDEVDAAFLAAMPGLMPAGMSETRAFADDDEIKSRSPDLFAPLKGLQGLGGIVGGMSALGAASDAGVMDQIKTTIDNVTSTTSSIQSGLQTLFGIGQWLYSHWWIIGLVAGVWIALKGYIGWLHLKALWRAGRAT